MKETGRKRRRQKLKKEEDRCLEEDGKRTLN